MYITLINTVLFSFWKEAVFKPDYSAFDFLVPSSAREGGN